MVGPVHGGTFAAHPAVIFLTGPGQKCLVDDKVIQNDPNGDGFGLCLPVSPKALPQRVGILQIEFFKHKCPLRLLQGLQGLFCVHIVRSLFF